MITFDNVEVKEASRIYGDMVEKVAFSVDVQAAPTVGAIVGSMVTAKLAHQNYVKNKEAEAEALRQKQLIENDYYQQIHQVMQNLKIIFTPINVIFSVNGQVFEIIQAQEMDQNMRIAFANRDGKYFANLLAKKMSMEIQLAQQAFAQQMLMRNMQAKQASFMAQQEYLVDGADSEEVVGIIKKANNQTVSLQLPVSFDTLRPFEDAADFTDETFFTKVAGVFDWFKKDKPLKDSKDNDYPSAISFDDLKKNVQIGFLPDRVLFLYNGQLFEQMSLLSMNEQGYEAFVKRDKDFFKKWFVDASKKISVSLPPSAMQKTSATIEEVVAPVFEAEVMEPEYAKKTNIFQESELHPMLYYRVLSKKYGEDWIDQELEALVKQIELDFNIADRVDDLALNKISVIYATMGEENSMFGAPFTFEKFGRAMNSKALDMVRFEGNLGFGELMFALQMAKLLRGNDVFYLFDDKIPQYIAEELYERNIRYVSPQIFVEDNLGELDFFEDINGYLMRKFKERDARGVVRPDRIVLYHQSAELIATIVEQILEHYAEQIDLGDPYNSTDRIIMKYRFLDFVPDDMKNGVRLAVREAVVEHLNAALYLEFKQEELAVLVRMLNL